jgi:hypothetical protein
MVHRLLGDFGWRRRHHHIPLPVLWQATQEVEEDRAKGKVTVQQRRGATDVESGILAWM